MVQRKVCTELGIQADHVESDKHMASTELASSKHQDGKSKGTDGMKTVRKSSSIKLFDLEALQSSHPRRSLFQPRKPSCFHVPTTATSPQKHKPLVRRSPNYMKPTSSSDAKKELLPASLRNTQYASDGKNLQQKCLSNSKSSSASNKKPAKTLSSSSSMNLERTLTTTPSFKPCLACPRKSTTAVLRADINAPHRAATCSSTLKDSKFPAHLMLNLGGIESEGASIMKICPYTYCSLNGNHRSPLPQFNCIMSARRRLLKTQKIIKLEAPQRLKVPHETRKDFDFEQIVFDEKPECDKADSCNPIITPLIREIGMDFFIEVYAKKREAGKMGRSDSVKHLEDQEGIKFAIEGNANAAGEEGIKLVTPCVPCDLPKSEIIPKEDFKIYFDAAAIEAGTKGSSHQEPNAEDASENHPPRWFHEETCTGSYCREVSYDGEHTDNIELDDSDSQDADTEWEEEQFCSVNHEDDIGSTVITQEETGTKLKSLSESSCDLFDMWLDDILSNHYADIMVEKALQEGKEEKNTCFEAQPRDTNTVQESASESIEFKTQPTDYPTNGIGYEYDQSSLEEEEFQYLTNTEDTVKEIEKHVDNEASRASMVLDEDTVENSEGRKICETRKIEESSEDNNTNLDNNDKEISQSNQIPPSNVPGERSIIVQDQELLHENQVRASKFQTISCIGGDKQHTSNNWQCVAKPSRPVQDVEEMRKINPRKPKFLPLVPDLEPEKVELKHQMMDDRKNAEEWMLDFALRQAVTKLAPAGKKKVALLVEAFETVMSTPKCETHMRNNSPFPHAKPIQACS